jgi:hypothetical protein
MGLALMVYALAIRATLALCVELLILRTLVPTIALAMAFVMFRATPRHAIVCLRFGLALRAMFSVLVVQIHWATVLVMAFAVLLIFWRRIVYGHANANLDSVERSAILLAQLVRAIALRMEAALMALACAMKGLVVSIALQLSQSPLARTTALEQVTAFKREGHTLVTAQVIMPVTHVVRATLLAAHLA